MQMHPIMSAPEQRRSERGVGFFELICVLFMVGTASAIVIPALNNAANRNRVYVGSELIAAQIRGARLAAITRNATFRVRFACPAADSLRVLAVTGDPTIDNATDRCDQNLANDRPAAFMPGGVSFGTLPTLEFNGRGQISIPSGTLPLSIVSTYGSFSRTLTVSATGRITTPGS